MVGNPDAKLTIAKRSAHAGLNSITAASAAAINDVMDRAGLNNISEAIMHMAASVNDGSPIKGLQLEEAAIILLQSLEPDHRAWVEELAAERSCPKWQIVMGAVSTLITQGRLQTVVNYNNWEGLESIEIDRATCKQCGQLFKPSRMGQVYCCNKCPSKNGGHNDGCPVLGLGSRRIPGITGPDIRGDAAIKTQEETVNA